ncbi:MAG: M48 family metallopeptidase [Planctomycetaceae bacterium]
MDFFRSQDVARRNTSLLVFYFILAVAMIVLALYALLLFTYGKMMEQSDPAAAVSLWVPELFLGVSVGTLTIILLGSLYKTSQLRGGGHVVAEELGGRLLEGETRDLRERMLLNIVEEMSIASGTPVPPVYLLDDEDGINAFAAGFTPETAVIGVTRGCLDRLKRDELQGVIAHEFSHILNGDMRLNIRLIGIVHGILLIALVGRIILRSVGNSSTRRSTSSSKKGKDGSGGFIILAIGLMAIGYIGVFFGKLIKSAVSRQREFLADSSAVQFTRNPGGIASALMNIGGFATGSKIANPRAEEASHMFFSNGLRASFLQLMSTHPPLVERIRRIDSSFNGKFPKSHVLTDEEAVAETESLAVVSQMNSQASAEIRPRKPKAESRFAFRPESSVEEVGKPELKHLQFATSFLHELPDTLRSAVHHPLGAQATLYALMLSSDEETRQSQLNGLAGRTDEVAFDLTKRLATFVDRLPVEYRIPVVELSLSALHRLSEAQGKSFHENLSYLAQADGQITLFEMGLLRIVIKSLFAEDRTGMPKSRRTLTKSAVQSEAVALLSALARIGHDEDAAVAHAYSAGMQRLPFQPVPGLLPAKDCGLPRISKSLDLLSLTPPQVKKQILQAAAETIGADGQITTREAELLRITAHSLGCPMPPLIVGQTG